MFLTLERILDKILDMPRWKRMPCIFLFAGFGAALLYFFLAGAILIWFTDLGFVLAGAIGCGLGTGLVNMVMVEFIKPRKF